MKSFYKWVWNITSIPRGNYERKKKGKKIKKLLFFLVSFATFKPGFVIEVQTDLYKLYSITEIHYSARLGGIFHAQQFNNLAFISALQTMWHSWIFLLTPVANQAGETEELYQCYNLNLLSTCCCHLFGKITQLSCPPPQTSQQLIPAHIKSHLQSATSEGSAIYIEKWSFSTSWTSWDYFISNLAVQ